MTEYLTEEEQIQQLKNWVKQYGVPILTGVVIAIAFTTGWHAFQQYREKRLLLASSIYETMLLDNSRGLDDETAKQATLLKNNHAKTPYAQLGGLMLARLAISHNDLSLAQKELNWVLTHDKSGPLQEITKLRLARLLLAENKQQEALQLVAQVKDPAFTGLASEIRGDILLAQHQTRSAAAAYQLALAELPENSRPVLQMKYDSLATH